MFAFYCLSKCIQIIIITIILIKRNLVNHLICWKMFVFFFQKQGRWGALHVCIAWQIYYHEQLKVIITCINILVTYKKVELFLKCGVLHLKL